MVNFGGHLKAVRQQEGGTNRQLYLVAYNDVKTVIYAHQQELFTQQWQKALTEASNDLSNAMQAVWETIFADLLATNAAPEEILRGAPPGTALQLYVEAVGREAASEVRTTFTHIHTAAVTNAEALRKLVKKYDKENSPQPLLSAQFLPRLYASNIFGSQAVLQETLGLLRALLDHDSDSDEDDHVFLPLQRHDSEQGHAQTVENRMVELEWLQRLVESIPPPELLHLVAHRGFHHIQDRNDRRPLENSLSAYETAWTSGVALCECDVALTKDEKLVLAHDDDFQRLALNARHANSTRRVADLTLKELMSLPLTSGQRPPLLVDVLRSANAISEQSKLVIEIKPGNYAAASALARLLWRHPELCAHVEVVMSFDAVTMHRLRTELAAFQAAEEGLSLWPSSRKGGHHQRLLSVPILSCNSLLNSGQVSPQVAAVEYAPSPQHHRYRKSIETNFALTSNSPIGLSLSQSNLLSQQNSMHESGNNINNSSSGGAWNTGSSTPVLETIANPPQAIPFTNDDYNHQVEQLQREGSRRYLPRFMLLTVAQKPKLPCELRVGLADDYAPVPGWLEASPEESLDGVYVQFEPNMMTKDGVAILQRLSQKYAVGVWGYSGVDPDNWDTFHWLVEQGNVTYVNTDLPTNFRKEVSVRTGEPRRWGR